MPSRLVFTLGLLILLVPTALRIYLLQPFPGSQELESIAFTYRLAPWVLPLQVVARPAFATTEAAIASVLANDVAVN